MLSCDVEINDFQILLGRSLDTLEHGTERAVEFAAVEGAEEARHAGRYQDRTGQLRAGIVAHFIKSDGRSVIWEILSPAKYSVFVENPTKAHIIRAKDGGFLAFPGSGGEMVFAREVHHPGTPGFPFMGPGYQQAERTLYREFDIVLRNIERLWD